MITLTGGNIQDGRGNLLNGFVTLQLTADATVIASPGLVVRAVPITFQFANGNLVGSCKTYSNAELTPQTQYNVIFADGNHSRLGDPALWQFNQAAGSSVDIGTMVGVAGGVSFPFPFGMVTVPFSATPVFPGSSANGFQITLTGNVSSSTFTPGPSGFICFKIIQDASGDRTFAWPPNVIKPMAPDPTPNAISVQAFYFDGSNAYPIADMTVN